jgi:hypothetical protein
VKVELQEDFHFLTGARTGQIYSQKFDASSVHVDHNKRIFTVRASEPQGKGRGVDIMLEIPFEIVPSLMEAILKSYSNEPD